MRRNLRSDDERSLVRHELTLDLLPDRYAVCRTDREVGPSEIEGVLVAVVRSQSEAMPTTLICPDGSVPDEIEADHGWLVVRLVGIFGFGEIGVLASLIVPLAQADVPTLVVGSFETDYVLVKTDRPDHLRQVLQDAGHSFVDTA
ncbi:MAG: ACT domain-containing protein [Planctomycetota bacterium]